MRCRTHHEQMRVHRSILHRPPILLRDRALEVMHEVDQVHKRRQLAYIARGRAPPVRAGDERRRVPRVVPRPQARVEQLHAREQQARFDVEDERVCLVGRVPHEHVCVLAELPALRRDGPLGLRLALARRVGGGAYHGVEVFPAHGE